MLRITSPASINMLCSAFHTAPTKSALCWPFIKTPLVAVAVIDPTDHFVLGTVNAGHERIHSVLPSHHLSVYLAMYCPETRAAKWRSTMTVVCVDVTMACLVEIFFPVGLCSIGWKWLESTGRCKDAMVVSWIPSSASGATALIEFESVSFGQVILIEHLTVFFTEASQLIRLIKSLQSRGADLFDHVKGDRRRLNVLGPSLLRSWARNTGRGW